MLRFLWLATRGHRFEPWDSPYLRWRIETYQGLDAGSLTGAEVRRFLWHRRHDMIRFLAWAGRMEREAVRRASS